MKRFLLTITLFISSLSIWAVTATPYPFDITQPDGSTITIRLVGDEYYSFYTSLDGTPLRRLDNGFFVEDNSVKEQFRQIAGQRRNAAASRAQTASSTFPLKGEAKSLVLLVSFKDKPFTSKLEDFDDLLNESGYSYNGATGSCRDYFIASSDSIFQPHFDVFGPFTVSEDAAYYGAEDGNSHDKNPAQMVIEACQLAAESGVNFADYDLDGDNILDNVFIYYAGHNQAEGGNSNTIWPHKSNLSWKNVKVGGISLATYACTSEYSGSGGTKRASIGTFCHEFGHVLGLPDLYDTDYNHYTVSNWSIMCSGNYNNSGRTPPTYSAYERFYLGWIKPKQLLNNGQYFLEPLQESNSAYLLATEKHNLIGDSPTPKEFFLMEYRTQTGWDTYLPGQGMLVWHIDYSAAEWANNTPNNATNGYLRIHLEEANGVTWDQRSNNDNGRSSDPYPGTQSVTTFMPKLHDGTVLTDQNIFDISEQSGLVSFIYKSLGDVKMTVDNHALSLTTTVSDNKKIVDWNPMPIVITTEGLISDTITFTTKGNFFVAVGEEAPMYGSNSWKRTLDYNVDLAGTNTHTVWVSFVPTRQSCDPVTSSLSVSTLGASILVSLTGYAPRPIYITTPEIKPISKITPYSFQLSWKPVEDAVLYYVTLYQVADGEATFKQDFEQFQSFDAIIEQGWESNTNLTTTSAKADGAKSLFFKNTGDYIVSEEYMAPLQSISFWVNAFFSDSVIAGYIDLDVWNGIEWKSLPDYRTEILSTTKRKTVFLEFDADTDYKKVRLTYTDIGGSGVAIDAFVATCARNLTYIYRGKELSIDAMTDEDICTYEIMGLEANSQYYCAMQSSDITKGCEEHVSPLSEPIEIKTIEVQEGKEGENRLPIAIDEETKTPIIYLSNPTLGSVLNVYHVSGVLICSLPVYNAVTEYAIPTGKLQSGNLYLVKYIEAGKMKRKQAWAKFVF